MHDLILFLEVHGVIEDSDWEGKRVLEVIRKTNEDFRRGV